MFDQVCRREETLDVLGYYTEDIHKPHRDFVRKLRASISAVVEIVWGQEVWKEVERSARLIRFPLWGDYQHVRLYLELEESGNTLKRFVFHIYHPQFICKSGRSSEAAREVREKYGRLQDMALNMAARFVGYQINATYFQSDQVPGSYPRLKHQQREIKDRHVQIARAALQAAFPQKHQELEAKKSISEERRKGREHLLRSISSGSLFPIVKDLRAEVTFREAVSVLAFGTFEG